MPACRFCRWSYEAHEGRRPYRLVLWCKRPGCDLVRTGRGHSCDAYTREPGTEG